MARSNAVYDFLIKNYALDEPIFLSEIAVPGMKDVYVRQQLKKMTEDGRIKRFDTGIYYLPGKTMFLSGSSVSVDDIIRKKYLIEDGKTCGYISGLLFANRIGLTTQVSGVYEIYTNKATTVYRETKVGNLRVIIRRPYIPVNERNAKALQFLDLIKDATEISEVEGSELTKRLLAYMKKTGLCFEDLKPYLSYYPDRIYRNLFEVGLLNGISA